jgi:hypothetical protein
MPDSPSPEVLKAIADLFKAIGGRSPTTEWLTPVGLKSYGFRLIDSMVRGIHASLRSR